MAIVTLCGGRQVIEVLAHGGDAIVATGTGSQYLQMIHRHRRFPHTGRVTVFTDVSRADVIQTLAGSRDAIVAVTTTLGFNILVIEVRR